jgi:hypothetical protein
MTRSRVEVAAASGGEAFTEVPPISAAGQFMLVVSALPVGDMGLRDAAMDIVRYPVAR